MKRLFKLVFAIFFVFCFQQDVLGADSFKIGMVDIEKFQSESISFQKIRGELKKRFDELQERLSKEEKELAQIEEDLKKQSMMLSFEAKEDKRKELEKKKRHYKYLVEESTREMKDAERDAIRSTGKEIEKVVMEIGKRDGYLMIIEKRSSGLLYFDRTYDITDEVIQIYDQKNK